MYKMSFTTRVGMLAMLTLFLSTPLAFQPNCFAQGSVFGRIEDTETNVDAYHYLVRPGAATVEVSAFGHLNAPGVYILEEGANLSFLLALTGGPDSFNQPDVKVETTVRLFRNSGGRQSLLYEASFEEVMDRAAETPVLSEGDIVTVEIVQKRRMNWRDVFTVIGPILSTLLLIERLTN